MRYIVGALMVIALVAIFLVRRGDEFTPSSAEKRSGYGEATPTDPTTTPTHLQLKQFHWSKETRGGIEEKETIIPSLEGTVTTEDGQTVPAVTISAFRGNDQMSIDATTTPNGKFVFYHLETGMYEIDVKPDKYVGEGNVLIIPGKTARCDIRAVARHIVRGCVRNEDGEPIPKASVNARSQPPSVVSATTNDAGEYELGVHQSYHIITVSAPFHEDERKWVEGRPDRVDFTIRKKKRREIDISGTVRDADGNVVPGIAVRIDVDNDQASWSDFDGRIHEEGEFTSATSDAAGVYRIHVILWGEANTLTIHSEEHRHTLPLTEGNNNIRHDIAFPWKSTGVSTVKGRIVDAITGDILTDGVVGKPFEGGIDKGKPFGPDDGAITTIQGRKRHVWLQIESGGYAGIQMSVFHDPSHPREIDLGEIRLQPTIDVSVLVRDENGLAVGWLAEIKFTDPESEQNVVASNLSAEGSPRFLIVARSERSKVRMTVRMSPYETHEEIFTVDHESAIDFREVNLKRRSPRTYTIMVTDNVGKPVENAVIEHEPDGAAVTDASGKAVISTVSDSCRVSAEGRLSANVNLPEDRETISVSLKSPGVIAGTVVTEDGTPVPGAVISCEDRMSFLLGPGSNPSSKGTSDARGHFEIRQLSAGEDYYRVWASHPYHDLRTEVMTERPGATDIVLIAKKIGHGDLVIQFAGEDPPEGTFVECDFETGPFPEFSFPDKRTIAVNGHSIEVNNIATSVYNIALSADGYAVKKIPDVKITTGTPTVIPVTMERGIVIVGNVADKEGNPVAGASVSADGQVHDYTSLDGSFTLKHIPSTTTSINVTKGNRSQTIDLTGRDLANLQIVLE